MFRSRGAKALCCPFSFYAVALLEYGTLIEDTQQGRT